MVSQPDSARRAAELFGSHPDFKFAVQNLSWVVELFKPPSDTAGH